MPAVPVPSPPPAPEEAATWTDFTGRLRALHEWCGRPKYRALCMRCPGLSPATVSTLIGKNPLTTPPETATARFVEACLRYRDWPDDRIETEVVRWTAHRALLATGDGGAVVTRAEASSVTAVDGTGREGAGRGGRWRGVVAAIVLAGAAAGVAAFVVGRGDGGGADGGQCHFLRGTIEDLRRKQTWPHMFQCPNRPGVGVYVEPGFGVKVAVLETDPSWFICWTRGEPHSGGNDVWYYTQGDRVTAMPGLYGWGYVPASDLTGDRAPDPAVTRRCR
ncbi:hypothetical protein ACH35V_10055 [Actinomadura sp. 1N219]|uniref:hypothetical protein n=1 Tax=Actinomadura sp. 1N219 TaxID=3375152 RepID=UPI00378F399B